MLATPRCRHGIDKENRCIGTEAKTPARKSLTSETPSSRKPLSRLYQEPTASQRRKSLGKVLQRSPTSKLEQGCTPRGASVKKIPARQKIKDPTATRKSRNLSIPSSSPSVRTKSQSITEVAESLLREVLLQEVTAVSLEYIQKKEKSLSEEHPMDVQTVAARLAMCTVQEAVKEITEEQTTVATPHSQNNSAECDYLVTDTPTTNHLWNIALGVDGYQGNDSDAFFYDNMGCATPSCKNTPPCMTGQGTRPSARSTTLDQNTPLRMVHPKSTSAPTLLANSSQVTTPSRLVCWVRSPVVSRSASDIINVGVGRMSVTRPNTVDRSIAMTPIMSHEASTKTTPQKPAATSDECVMTTPAKLSNASSMTTPVSRSDANFGTTPVGVVDSSAATTPARTQDRSTVTVPVSVLGVASGTMPKKSVDIGLGTTTAPSKEVSVGSSPYAMIDAQCGMTPMKRADVKSGTTPFRPVTEVGTVMTPVGLSNVETLTSPIVVSAIRLEAESPSQLDPSRLLSHVESASISNELLRREVSSLREAQAQLRDQLKEREIEQRLERQAPLVEARSHAKVSIQTEVEGLMVQVGQQMNQIGLLQEALDLKSTELGSVLENRDRLREQYQRETSNLQEDLRTAYKQHQQEVIDLRAESERVDYEPHYKRAISTIMGLRTELEAFTDLKTTLDKAADIQAQFEGFKECYTVVKALFTKTMAKKDQLHQQHNEMELQMAAATAHSEQLRQSLAAAEAESRHLETRLMDASSAEKGALLTQGRILAELNDVGKALEEAKQALDETRSELSVSRGAHEAIKVQVDDLQQKAVAQFLSQSSLEAALTVQGKQWQGSIAELDTARRMSATKVTELTIEKTRLTSKVSSIQCELAKSTALVLSLQEELDGSKTECLKERQAAISLRDEVDNSNALREEARRIRDNIKKYREEAEFMEEERLSLVESAREAEEQFKVATLELSRLERAHYEAQENAAHWKVASAALSEQLLLLQSELDHSKANAHWLLLNQASEIADAANGMTTLTTRIRNICAYLGSEEQVKMSSNTSVLPEATQTLGGPTGQPEPSRSARLSGSFVASVLCAVRSKDEEDQELAPGDGLSPSPEKMTPAPIADQTPAPITDQKPALQGHAANSLPDGGSGSTAFTAVQAPSGRTLTTDAHPLQPTSDENKSLLDQVDQVRALIGQLVQMLLTRSETLELAIEEGDRERSDLNEQLLQSHKDHDSELHSALERLRDAEQREGQLSQELTCIKASLTDQQRLVEYAQWQMQAMAGENLGRSTDQKGTVEKLQSEVVKLTGNLRLAQRDSTHLQEHLDYLLKGSSQSSGQLPTDQMGSVIRENLSLKKDVEKLRLRLVERSEYYESQNTRSTRHMQVLEDNWHKADAEVDRLDELFDHCKKLIGNVPQSTDEPPAIADIREILK